MWEILHMSWAIFWKVSKLDSMIVGMGEVWFYNNLFKDWYA